MWVCESRFVTNTHTHPRTHALMHSLTDTQSEHVTSSSKVDNCHIALMVVVTYSLLHEVLQSIVFDLIFGYSITSIGKADTHRVCCKFPFVSQFLIFSKAAFITVNSLQIWVFSTLQFSLIFSFLVDGAIPVLENHDADTFSNFHRVSLCEGRSNFILIFMRFHIQIWHSWILGSEFFETWQTNQSDSVTDVLRLRRCFDWCGGWSP
jgi:hypothetical protein